MGQARSRRRAGRTPHPTPSGRGVGSGMDLTLLPQELLALILSWVPGRALVTRGRLVCRQWRDLIDGPTLWKLQWGRDPAGREGLEAARRCPRLEWARVGVLQPFGRNLVKNFHGDDQCHDWQIEHGHSMCWGGYPCRKALLVDLVKEGLWEDLLDTVQLDIFVSDWWGVLGECHCAYKLYVVLLAADKNSEIARFMAAMESTRMWSVPFQQASHVFRKYGPGVRYLRFQHFGICPGPEQTEAHITNATVLVKLSG